MNPIIRNDDDRRIWTEGHDENLWMVPDKFEPGDIALDCGGHIGAVAILCAERGAKVFTVEPSNDNLSILAANCRGNGDITIIPKAIVHEGAPATIRLVHCPVPGGYSGHTTVLHADWGDSEEVQTITFDTLLKQCGEKIRYAKVNIEGSEYAILSTTKELHRIKTIAVQFHNIGGSHQNLFRRKLVKEGFREVAWQEIAALDPPHHPNFWNFVGTRE